MIASVKTLATIAAVSTGGRNGHSETTDKLVSVDLSVPKALGGPGKPNIPTPEHLFAAGYAACFGGSLDFVAKSHKKDATKATTTCTVGIGPREGGGLGLVVDLKIEDPSLPQAELEAFVREAHETICAYSHATRGNIAVNFTVVGA